VTVVFKSMGRIIKGGLIMKITGKIQVPTTQYGYIMKEYVFENDDDSDKIMVNDFKRIYSLWKWPNNGARKPSHLCSSLLLGFCHYR